MDQDHVKHCWKHGSKLSLRWIFGCNYRTLRRHFWLSTYQTGDRLHSKKRWWSWITSIPQFPNQLEKELFMRKSARSRMKSHWHLCVKIVFPYQTKLTPGLMIMTCDCPKKVVYGFSLMTSGESPQMIFDLVMFRFPSDYSPNIVYYNCMQIGSVCVCVCVCSCNLV